MSCRCPRVRSAEVAGPGFLNLFLADSWFADALGDALARGGPRSAVAPQRPPNACRWRWCPRTRRGRSRWPRPATARTGTAWPGCSRSPGTPSSASTTTTTQAAQMDRFRASVDNARRGEEPPEDGYHGALHRGARAGVWRPGAADARVDRGCPGALSHSLRHLRAPERRRDRDSARRSRCSIRSRRTAPSGRGRPRTVTRRTGS